MDTKNNNRVNMIDATILICDGNTSATGGITNFALRLADAKAKRVLVNGMNQVASGNTKGVTTDTKLIRSVMTNKALKCANATGAFANDTKNSTLKELVNYNESKLDKLSKDEVADVCQKIHDATDANFAGAEPFGLVASDVTDLQAGIDLYRVSSQNPREATIKKSQATKQTKKMIRELINELLKGQLDKMVNTIKETQNDFWLAYFQAREIIDLGTTTAKVRGTVLDINEEPLKNVTFAVYAAGTTNAIKVVLTDIKGKFNTGKLSAGDYDFKWTLPGYQTLTEEGVHIAAGKELQRKVVMEQSSGNTVNREGTLPSPGIAEIDLAGVHGNPSSTITIVLSAMIRAYSAVNSTDPPGATFIDIPAGTHTYNLDDFAALVGFSSTNTHLLIQNIGMSAVTYKFTFENV